ncbi:MAG: ATP synthase F1 subunit gamma [Planctomycetaceae bacterium]|nr:ATP synthase F1 subunit gamma [Planctomycetaceae bacterium]
MAGIKELRGRIKSVGNIKQITRAMEMVATTKLRRFQDRAVASRPYAREIGGLVGRLAAELGDSLEERPLFRPGAGERTAVLVVSSDRGLCGAYNSNVFRELLRWRDGRPEAEQRELAYQVYGRKGYQWLTARGREVDHFFVEPPLEKLDFAAAVRVARVLTDGFLAGKYRDVLVLYTAFESMVKFVPTWLPLLPIRPESLGVAEGDTGSDMILEPDAATIFDNLIPRYLEIRIYNALLESLTSEFASRRFSMKSATDAAGDMQQALRGVYNRKRQETITKELLDIVGGAEALR